MPIPLEQAEPRRVECGKPLFGPDEALIMAICNGALAAMAAGNWGLHDWLMRVIEADFPLDKE